MSQYILSVYVFSFIYFSSACEEPWVFTTKQDMFGRTVAFKNVTTIGKRQLLSWTWSEPNGVIWENKITRNLQDGSIEGILAHGNRRHGMGLNVRYEMPRNKESTFKTINKKIFDASWNISVCNVINMSFEADETGYWEFIIGENNVVTYVKDSSPPIDIVGKDAYRRKRSELEEMEEQSNITLQKAGVLDCIYDFFFAEGDSSTGRSGGVFTRVKNWMKGVACRIRGDCEPGDPSDAPSYIPEVTMPPFNPDAESADEQPSEAEGGEGNNNDV